MFLVSADPRVGQRLSTAARAIGGKPLNSCWIVDGWYGSADSLARRLRRDVGAGVIVCRLGEWSYQL